MKKMVNVAVRVLGIAAVLASAVMVSSCTNEQGDQVVARRAAKVEPQGDYYAVYTMKLNCTPKASRFDHVVTSTMDIFNTLNADEPVESFKKELSTICTISCSPETVRVSEGTVATQTAISIDRSFVGNKENDIVRLSISDGRIITLNYTGAHASEYFMNDEFVHGHDSLISARLIKVENEEVLRRASQYVKNTYNTKYFVEVETQVYNGNEVSVSRDLDTLSVNATTLVLDDNNTDVNKTATGEEVLNETQQKDSVIITKTWADGHSERLSFNTILNRSLKNIEKREVMVNSFDNRTAGSSFSKLEGGEQFVREDGMWKVYGREVVVTKMVSVDGNAQEVRYTFYQERADFNYEGISHSFGYVDWTVNNYADDFNAAAVSDKDGYDELTYRNEIKTYYLGYVQMSNEVINWYKEAIKINGYGVVNASRKDFATYTLVNFEKIAYYSDGSVKSVGSYTAELPIFVIPNSNWVITTDVWGVYTSNDFGKELNSKTAKTADKFFSYNQYLYTCTNTVSGEENKFTVSVPNDIVFNDGDVEYKFENSELKVNKKNENIVFATEDGDKSTYAYTCVAGVEFGGADQEVTLPGTVNIIRHHEHGKVVSVFTYTTPNENRSYWKSTAAITFEDGYTMIAIEDFSSATFNDFSLSSTKSGVNSAVYANGSWIPAIASDESNCMLWKDENGTKKRVLDYVTATAQRWNDGHNTVVDVRREGRISEGGYTVTFYLNGLACQTLRF